MSLNSELMSSLAPLQEEREKLSREREELMTMREEKDREIQTIDRVLRAAGLLEKPKPRATNSRTYRWAPSQAIQDKVMDWVNAQTRPFSRNEMSAGTGYSLASVDKVLGILRNERLVRHLGRYQGGRTHYYAPMDMDLKE